MHIHLHIWIYNITIAVMINPLSELTTTQRQQAFSPEMARAIAHMLGHNDSNYAVGSPVPIGWHFPLFMAETPRTSLRQDGFPGLGLPFPDVAGTRLVAAGRKVETYAALHIGQKIIRTSRVLSIIPKTNTQGDINIVKVGHVIEDLITAGPILREEQSYVTMNAPFRASTDSTALMGENTILASITPDYTMLFQFSALSLNSHKIHLDRSYATDVEGYPDLVVNGGLTTLLMTEILRAKNRGPHLRLSLRNLLPLFVNRPIQIAWDQERIGRRLLAFDERGRLAAEMEIVTDEL